MKKGIQISWLNLIVCILIISLTTLLIIQVVMLEDKTDVIIQNSDLVLYDDAKNEIDLLEIYLNPDEEVIYYLEMKYYNIEDLQYRIVFDFNDEIIDYLEIRFNDELLEKENCSKVSTWKNDCVSDIELFEISFLLNNKISEDMTNKTYLFDLSVESIK